MFTGIVRATGTIRRIDRRGGDVRLAIESPDLDCSAYDAGESIAVSGVCLTALNLHRGGFEADVSRETLDVTTLGTRSAGSTVNLEPSLAVGDRLGGHLVTGHVDCLGRLESRGEDARSVRLVFSLPHEFARYLARKGSVAVDGVSLTVNAAEGDRFEVNIIPHTAEVTTLGRLAPGDEVNVEVDLMARYAERLLGAGGGSIDTEFLKAHGYA
jgi:riboflavin synthase